MLRFGRVFLALAPLEIIEEIFMDLHNFPFNVVCLLFLLSKIKESFLGRVVDEFTEDFILVVVTHTSNNPKAYLYQ